MKLVIGFATILVFHLVVVTASSRTEGHCTGPQDPDMQFACSMTDDYYTCTVMPGCTAGDYAMTLCLVNDKCTVSCYAVPCSSYAKKSCLYYGCTWMENSGSCQGYGCVDNSGDSGSSGSGDGSDDTLGPKTSAPETTSTKNNDKNNNAGSDAGAVVLKIVIVIVVIIALIAIVSEVRLCRRNQVDQDDDGRNASATKKVPDLEENCSPPPGSKVVVSTTKTVDVPDLEKNCSPPPAVEVPDLEKNCSPPPGSKVVVSTTKKVDGTIIEITEVTYPDGAKKVTCMETKPIRHAQVVPASDDDSDIQPPTPRPKIEAEAEHPIQQARIIPEPDSEDGNEHEPLPPSPQAPNDDDGNFKQRIEV